MAGEVIYADIKVPAGASHSGPPRPAARRAKLQRCPHWHRPALWISGGLHIVVVIGFIGISVWAFREENETKPIKECANSSGSSSALCKVDWQLHSEKCYFFSENLKTWSQSHEECSSRNSHLAVIDDVKEMDFVTSNFKNSAWIGLFNTTPGRRWTWVNGSAYNGIKLPGSATKDGCGTVKLSSIGTDSCGTPYRYICQKDINRT
ncbi:hypothetical protein NDU88_000713 [Pleurodeles waltl]|uniref:C-type lectin domain-containing protein n=1 Tax=Pleurodeles waltl TaxID=8319 RepID=A0AAV7PAG3_PLEWA|nr:hypothetical protein NDU88_000713 [Pleurodeles waltl]